MDVDNYRYRQNYVELKPRIDPINPSISKRGGEEKFSEEAGRVIAKEQHLQRSTFELVRVEHEKLFHQQMDSHHGERLEYQTKAEAAVQKEIAQTKKDFLVQFQTQVKTAHELQSFFFSQLDNTIPFCTAAARFTSTRSRDNNSLNSKLSKLNRKECS